MQQHLTEFLSRVGDILSVWLVWGFNGYYILVTAALANLWALVVVAAGAVVIRAAQSGAE